MRSLREQRRVSASTPGRTTSRRSHWFCTAANRCWQAEIAYHGAPETGLHVDRNRLDEALSLPGVAARQFGERGLCATCRACPIRQVCGGGLYAHRYRAGTGFANPSVYCADLIRLISHIHDTMRADIRARLA